MERGKLCKKRPYYRSKNGSSRLILSSVRRMSRIRLLTGNGRLSPSVVSWSCAQVDFDLFPVTRFFHESKSVLRDDEFEVAINYYEERESGLGEDFAMEVASTIDRIIAHTKAWKGAPHGFYAYLVRIQRLRFSETITRVLVKSLTECKDKNGRMTLRTS